MADEIERLDLVIGSSTSKASKAVEDLITSLSKLESGLTSFSGDKLDGSIKNLSTTFRNLSEAINIVNVDKVSNLNKNIRALASSLGKLDKASSLSSFGNAFSAMNDFKNTFNTEVEGVIRDFGIVGKESTDEVTKSLREISNIAKQGANYDVDKMNNAIENVVNSLKSGATDVSNFKNEYTDLLEYIRNTKNKIYIPEAKDVVNYGEKRKRLGQNFTSNEKYRDRTDITSYVRDMQEIGLVPNIDTTRSSADVFDQLVQEVIKAREETDRLNEDFRKSKTTISAMYSSAMDFADAMLKANSVKEKALSGDVNGSQIAMTMEGIDSFSGINVDPDKAKDISNLASAFSKFGSKTATTAIKNIPQLSTALNQLITSVNKLPAVDKNIVDFTGNLARLAETGRKVGSVANSVNNNIVTTQKSVAPFATGTKRHFKGLASYIGKFYATYFMVIRGIRQLWSSITSAMDYVEVYNYFDSAFGQVADKAVANWKDAGYESAEGYYNSFRQRASELTKQMTGYTVSDTGTLSAVNQDSLGLNVTQLMNYQSMFAQMSSSMGVASENALRLSRLMTELGADLASVKNMNVEEVWSNMASGIVGMSRAVDKYGINIRNAALQEELLNLGITTNVTKLSQDEKALLRMIVMLDSTRYAWGDLANTINQPANQLRLLQASFANLARTIGNLFLPIVAKVIPYLNALTIAITRVIQSFVDLFGFNVTDWGKGSSKSFTNLVDYMDDVSYATDTATGSVKEYQNTVMGFDEINKLNPETESGGGAGGVGGIGGGDLSKLQSAFDALANEYQSSWDAAFKGMENRAQKMADKIEKILQPVKDLVQHLYHGQYYEAGQDVGEMATAILEAFRKAIDSVDWYELGKRIGKFLKGLPWKEIILDTIDLVQTIWEALVDVWKGSFDEAPVETVLLSLLGVAASPVGKKVGKLAGKKIGGTVLSGLGGALAAGATGVGVGFAGELAAVVGTTLLSYWGGNKIFEFETGEKAGLFSDQIKGLMSITPKELKENLVPSLKETAKIMGDFLFTTNKNTAKEGIKLFDFDSLKQSNEIIEMINKGLIGISNSKTGLQSIPGLLLQMSQGFTDLRDTLSSTSKAISNASSSDVNSIKEVENGLASALDIHGKLSLAFTKYESQYNSISDSIKRCIEATTGLTREQFDQKYGVTSLTDEYKMLVRLTGNDKDAEEKLAKQLGVSADGLFKLEGAYNTYKEKLKTSNLTIEEQEAALEDLIREYEASGQGAYEFSNESVAAALRARTGIEGTLVNLKNSFSNITTNMKEHYTNILDRMKNSSNSIFSNIYNIITNISQRTGIDGGNFLKNAFVGAIDTKLPNIVASIFNGLRSKINGNGIGYEQGSGLANGFINGFNNNSGGITRSIKDLLTDAFSGTLSLSSTFSNIANKIKLSFRANGGYVDPGQLFVAREAGPEMVGTIGGRTAVANNDQITTAIASAVAPAVYNAVVQAMGNLNTNVNVNLVGDAEGLFTAVVDQDRNYQRRTGSSAFA